LFQTFLSPSITFPSPHVPAKSLQQSWNGQVRLWYIGTSTDKLQELYKAVWWQPVDSMYSTV
jgi:hypothetical protein